MIMIFDMLVLNDDCFFKIFSKILIFRVASGVKWEKMAQNDKNCTSQESYVI